jgi:hypothetical protein
MTDPAIQAYAAKTNAAYAREMASQPKKGTMTADTAASLAAALNPMTMVAQQQATMNYIAQLAPIMPALMRSQRVTQLALVKNCGWMTAPALGLYPGTVIPEAVAPVRSR